MSQIYDIYDEAREKILKELDKLKKSRIKIKDRFNKDLENAYMILTSNIYQNMLRSSKF